MSFYQKYRPQKFMDLVGQDHIKRTLTNALSQGKIGHAYLFSGPRGVGKTTVARLLAKSLNCERNQQSTNDYQLSTNFEPCNECSSCIDIIQDKSLDVIEIDAASNRGIDEMKNLIEKIKFAPSKSKYKVYIIDEVHMLSKDAFNALLKTLEEPPKHAIFVMATTELHKVPVTILSRVQQFDFKRASLENTLSNLKRTVEQEKVEIEPLALRLVAQAGDGSYRDSLSILDQVVSYGSKKITLKEVHEILGMTNNEVIIKFLQLLSQNNLESTLEMLNNLFDEGIDLLEFNRRLVEMLRRIMIFKANSKLLEKAELTDEQKEEIRNISTSFSQEKILEMIKMFIEAGHSIKGSNLPQLPLELAVMDLCDHGPKPEARSQKLEVRKENIIKNVEEKKEPKSLDEARDKETKVENPVVADVKPINSIGLKQKWPDLLREIGPENMNLFSLLKESDPRGIDNDEIVIAVKYKFFAEKIADKKNIKIISPATEKVFGKIYPIHCIIDENIITFASQNDPGLQLDKSDPLVKDTLDVFGI